MQAATMQITRRIMSIVFRMFWVGDNDLTAMSSLLSIQLSQRMNDLARLYRYGVMKKHHLKELHYYQKLTHHSKEKELVRI